MGSQASRSTASFALVVVAALSTATDQRADAQHAWVKVTTVPQLVQAVATATSTGTPTTIAVAPGEYVFTNVADTSMGPSLLPPIDTSIWIVGTDAITTTLTGRASEGRLFTVLAGGHLVVRNVTLTRFDIGPFGPGGGAAANFGGFLRIDGSRVIDNAIGTAAEIEPDGIYGGAILNVGGRVHIQDSTLAGNRVDCGGGGALALLGGSATVLRTLVRDNEVFAVQCSGAGGGIYVASAAALTIAYSTIAGNRAGDIGAGAFGGDGGGISNRGSVWMRNSAVIRNGVEYVGDGGGVDNRGTMTMKNTTVAGNDAGWSGGGIANRGRLFLQGVTITDNQARGNDADCYPEPDATRFCGGGGLSNFRTGFVRTARTVLAGNEGPGEPFLGTDCRGVLFSDGYNAIGDTSACNVRRSWTLAGAPTRDLLNVYAELGALRDNGKPGNAHHPLRASSPLIDAGGKVSAICTSRDQIGRLRVDADFDGVVECDIGAIEYPAP